MVFKIHSKEKTYLILMSIIGACSYVLLFALLVLNPQYIPLLIGYALVFYVIGYIMSAFMLGHLKGNAIKINEKQFPEITAILKEHCAALKINKVPDMYILQGNGLLNAFAIRLVRKNCVVLFSDVLEVAYDEGIDAVSFIIGHELGHIHRNHISKLKSWLLWPASWIPFLNLAYSRACEYTCDSIGYALCPQGAAKGLLVLTAGKKLYKKVSVNQLLCNKEYQSGQTSLVEFFSTHPPLLKRIAVINQQDHDRLASEKPFYISPNIESLKEKE